MRQWVAQSVATVPLGLLTMAALAGAAAAAMVFGGLRASGAPEAPAGYGVLSAVIIVVLVAATVCSFLADRKGWAVIAIMGLVVSALCTSVSAPHQLVDPGVRGGFDPATVPDDYAECSFDASRPGCGG